MSESFEAAGTAASDRTVTALLAALPASAVFQFDVHLRLRLAGTDGLPDTGLGDPTRLGEPAKELLEPSLGALIEPRLRAALHGIPFDFEYERRGRIYVARGAPMRGRSGSIESVLVLAHDVTDRRRAWLSQRDQVARQAFLFELVDRMRTLSDPEMIKYEASRALGERLGAARVGYLEDLGDGERFAVARNHRRAYAASPARSGSMIRWPSPCSPAPPGHRSSTATTRR